MTALAILAGSIVAWTICSILRAPLGFQTDRGFFYGIPNKQQAKAEQAAERLGIGGGADFHNPSSDIPGA